MVMNVGNIKDGISFVARNRGAFKEAHARLCGGIGFAHALTSNSTAMPIWKALRPPCVTFTGGLTKTSLVAGLQGAEGSADVGVVRVRGHTAQPPRPLALAFAERQTRGEQAAEVSPDVPE